MCSTIIYHSFETNLCFPQINGHSFMGHIDDSFLMSYTLAFCEENVWETVNTFLRLGFVIHPTKSVLIPMQELEFLGFLLNSSSMSVCLPPRKATTVKQACDINLLQQGKPTIREACSDRLISFQFP